MYGLGMRAMNNSYGHPTLPMFHSVASLDTYVFSKDFYEGRPTSLIEIMVTDYLNRSTINAEHLYKFIDIWGKLERLEQFYFGPLLFALLREVDREVCG